MEEQWPWPRLHPSLIEEKMRQRNMRRIPTSALRNGKTGMEQSRRNNNFGSLCRKREGRKHRTERCKDLCGEYKCVRNGKRSKKELIRGMCHVFKWMGNEFNNTAK